MVLLARRDFFNQLSIRIKLISFDTQRMTLRRMVGEIGDDEIDDSFMDLVRGYSRAATGDRAKLPYRAICRHNSRLGDSPGDLRAL